MFVYRQLFLTRQVKIGWTYNACLQTLSVSNHSPAIVTQRPRSAAPKPNNQACVIQSVLRHGTRRRKGDPWPVTAQAGRVLWCLFTVTCSYCLPLWESNGKLCIFMFPCWWGCGSSLIIQKKSEQTSLPWFLSHWEYIWLVIVIP